MLGESRDHAAIDAAIDGRILRSRRTRQALIDALISLIEEGDLRPTAPRIAERAGVSLRSIYHHFDDLELLFADAAAGQMEKFKPLHEALPARGPASVRIQRLLEQRIRIWETVTPVRLAATLQEPFSEQLRLVRSEIHDKSRQELARVFSTELAGRSHPDAAQFLDALDATVNWTVWRVMRTDMALSIEAALAVMRRNLMALLDDSRVIDLASNQSPNQSPSQSPRQMDRASVHGAESGSVSEGVDGSISA